MGTILINSENSKTPDKINLMRKNNYVALLNLSIYYTWKNVRKSCKSYKFKISAPTWNEESELPDGLYSVLDIQDYFEYLIKTHETVTNNPLEMIYVNKIENRTTLKTSTGYYVKLLTPEATKVLGSTISKITKDKNGENFWSNISPL